MEAIQYCAKVFATRNDATPQTLIDLFHRWIQVGRLEDQMLIDVVDYSHVHQGPGVLLVAQAAYFGVDHAHGRTGLLYRARRGDVLAAGNGFRSALTHVLRAAALLQEDLPQVAFDASLLEIGADDRLRATNDDATFEAARPHLEELAKALGGAQIERGTDAKGCFRATLKGSSPLEPTAALSLLGA